MTVEGDERHAERRVVSRGENEAELHLSAGSEGLPGQDFPAEFRLRREADFDRVFAVGKHVADQMLVIHGCRNGLSYSRLGLSISRRLGNAVERNRWKRRIREAWRQQRTQLPMGFDVVVRPRKGAKLDYHAIERSLPGLMRRLVRQLRDEGPPR